MLANKKQSLLFQRYDMDAYRRYLAMLSQAVQKAAEGEDEETVSLLLQGILWAEEVLQKTKDETNPLAFRTRDIPEFELGDKSEDYIRRVERILEE